MILVIEIFVKNNIPYYFWTSPSVNSAQSNIKYINFNNQVNNFYVIPLVCYVTHPLNLLHEVGLE